MLLCGSATARISRGAVCSEGGGGGGDGGYVNIVRVREVVLGAHNILRNALKRGAQL